MSQCDECEKNPRIETGDPSAEPLRNPDDPESWSKWISEHFAETESIARRCCKGNADEAEEVLSIAWEKAWESRHKLPSIAGGFMAWMSSIIMNTATDEYRRSKAKKRGGDCVELSVEDLEAGAGCLQTDGSPDSPRDRAYAQEMEEMLLRELALLPELQRKVCVLYMFEEYTHPMVARELGISVSKSKHLLAQARERLRPLFFEH